MKFNPKNTFDQKIEAGYDFFNSFHFLLAKKLFKNTYQSLSKAGLKLFNCTKCYYFVVIIVFLYLNKFNAKINVYKKTETIF